MWFALQRQESLAVSLHSLHRSGLQIAMGFPGPKLWDFAGEGLGSKYGDQL